MKQGGFTLIELVVTTVILSVLTAVALPIYADMSTASRYALLEQTVSAAQTAANLVYSKAVLQNQTGATGQITMSNGTTITLAYGYPDASKTGIVAALYPLTIQVNGPIIDGTGQYMQFMVVNAAYTVTRCYFSYYQATSSTVPTYYVFADSNPLASNGPAGVSQCVN